MINKPFRSVLFGSALLMLLGMSPPPEPSFDADSKDVIFPSFNFNYSLLSPDDMKFWRLGIELGNKSGSGNDRDYQSGYKGNSVLDGTVFPAPAYAKMRYFINNSTAIVRGGLWIKGRAGFEMLVGIGRIDLNLKAYSQGVYAHIEENQNVILTGAHIIAPFPGPFNFYYRGILLDNKNDISLTSLEMGLSYPASKNLNIYAGAQRWDYYYEGNQSRSDIYLDLSGYTAGLRLTF